MPRSKVAQAEWTHVCGVEGRAWAGMGYRQRQGCVVPGNAREFEGGINGRAGEGASGRAVGQVEQVEQSSGRVCEAESGRSVEQGERVWPRERDEV